ncbi:hypothetical protein F511_31452 [Dorcoceras hygrometricum]|uniref:Uncharacterized protein n=1 Tax=Dorcoceras hygrometricum TaxID=472368 RepID=A0A2Z7DEN9_9LAMI|nr:hypothetical protein F511_31452 [Dorcoceras hygrometricum]
MGMNRMFTPWTRARWAGPSPSLSLFNIDLGFITLTTTQLTLTLSSRRRPPLLKPHAAAAAATAASFAGTCSSQLDEENPSGLISSGLLVQADEGVSHPVMDLIDVVYRHLP